MGGENVWVQMDILPLQKTLWGTQFRRIRRECPGKNYEQGPLLALHLMHGK